MGIFTTIAAVGDVHMAEAFLFALGSFFALAIPVAFVAATVGAVYHLLVCRRLTGLFATMVDAVRMVFQLPEARIDL